MGWLANSGTFAKKMKNLQSAIKNFQLFDRQSKLNNL